MKRAVFLIFFLLVPMFNNLASGARPASAAVGGPSQVAVTDVSVFYDQLSPYGRWFEFEGSWAWIPSGVESGWRPYTHGYWVYTEDGWLWVSYETWGWAPFHYGRWTFNPTYGWIWVPGTIWSPAWVVWRQGPGFIGWAPLPLEARFVGGRLIEFDVERIVEPQWYSFVDERRFTDQHLERIIEVPARNITIIHTTKNITTYTFENSRVNNHGIAVQEIEKVTNKRVEKFSVTEANSAAVAHGGKVNGRDVALFRPKVEEKKPDHLPPTARNQTGAARDEKKEKEEQQQLQKQHEKDLYELNLQKAKEKNKLEKQHDQELRNAQKEQQEQIKQRQEAEHSAHDARWQKEEGALKSRHQMENNRQLPSRPITANEPRGGRR